MYIFILFYVQNVYICTSKQVQHFTKVNIKKTYAMKSINLARKHHEILQKEFSQVSRQTIHTALRYFNNSDVAKQIRKRALELLQQEIDENPQDSLDKETN